MSKKNISKRIAEADSNVHGRQRVILAFSKDNVLAKRFGQRLRHLMTERCLTQKRLGKEIAVAQSAVSNWLNGSLPRGAELFALATYFGVSIENLLTAEEKPLTHCSEYGRIGIMKLDMPGLLDRVRRLTKERGTRAELARALGGISDSRVSEWLSGKSEPDGRYTLKLLQWVEDQASKK